jgi:hypothetical protein
MTHNFSTTHLYVLILYMFQATVCSSPGGQLYEYNFWYNHSALVTVQYAGRDGTAVLVTGRYAG